MKVIKAKKKNILMFLMFFGLFFLISFQGMRSAKAQGYTTLIGGIGVYDVGVIVDLPYKVHINDNWSDVEKTYDWCNGSGTLLDPYLVENIRIDGALQGSPVFVENSKDYFLIRNCIFENSGRNGEFESGVRMKNISNGFIVNCNFSFNMHGISVYESSDVHIGLNGILGSHNDILTGFGKTVYIEQCYKITVKRIFSKNHYDGICSRDSNNIDMRDNIIVNEFFGFTHDSETAVYLFRTNYSYVINNTIFGTSPTPISSSIKNSQDDTLGIQLVDSFFNTVYGNSYFNINDFPDYGNDELAIPGYGIFLFVVSIGFIIVFLVRKKGQINVNL